MPVLMLGLITAGWCEFLIWSGIYAAFHGFFGSFGCICELGFIGVEKLRRVKRFKNKNNKVVGQCLLHLFVSLFFFSFSFCETNISPTIM